MSIVPPGTYSDSDGLPACVPCPPGRYASSLGSTNCSDCAAGTVAPWGFNCTGCNATQMVRMCSLTGRPAHAPRETLRLTALASKQIDTLVLPSQCFYPIMPMHQDNMTSSLVTLYKNEIGLWPGAVRKNAVLDYHQWPIDTLAVFTTEVSLRCCADPLKC